LVERLEELNDECDELRERLGELEEERDKAREESIKRHIVKVG